MPYAIVDIETVPDWALLGDVLYRCSADEAPQRWADEVAVKGGSAMPPIPFHRPVSIAVGTVGADSRLARVESLAVDQDEESLVRDFWARAEGFLRNRGCLVTYNGRGFDLPVLELRGLHYGVPAPTYYETKWGARYRFQTAAHLDVQEYVTNYGALRGLRGGLEILLRLCGLDGKGDVRGGDVQTLWEAGRLDEIHAYCRKDVIETYLLFLRVQVVRGLLRPDLCTSLTRDTLSAFGLEAEASAA